MSADFLHNHPQFPELIRIVAQPAKDSPIDFMRHYYDVYSLLRRPEVQAFIGTEAYKAHKTSMLSRSAHRSSRRESVRK